MTTPQLPVAPGMDPAMLQMMAAMMAGMQNGGGAPAPAAAAVPEQPVIKVSLDDYLQQRSGANKSWTFDKMPLGTSYLGIVERDVTDNDVRPAEYEGKIQMLDATTAKTILVIPMRMFPAAGGYEDGHGSFFVTGDKQTKLNTAMAAVGWSSPLPPKGMMIECTHTSNRKTRSGTDMFIYTVRCWLATDPETLRIKAEMEAASTLAPGPVAGNSTAGGGMDQASMMAMMQKMIGAQMGGGAQPAAVAAPAALPALAPATPAPAAVAAPATPAPAAVAPGTPAEMDPATAAQFAAWRASQAPVHPNAAVAQPHPAPIAQPVHPGPAAAPTAAAVPTAAAPTAATPIAGLDGEAAALFAQLVALKGQQVAAG